MPVGLLATLLKSRVHATGRSLTIAPLLPEEMPQAMPPREAPQAYGTPPLIPLPSVFSPWCHVAPPLHLTSPWCHVAPSPPHPLCAAACRDGRRALLRGRAARATGAVTRAGAPLVLALPLALAAAEGRGARLRSRHACGQLGSARRGQAGLPAGLRAAARCSTDGDGRKGGRQVLPADDAYTPPACRCHCCRCCRCCRCGLPHQRCCLPPFARASLSPSCAATPPRLSWCCPIPSSAAPPLRTSTIGDRGQRHVGLGNATSATPAEEEHDPFSNFRRRQAGRYTEVLMTGKSKQIQ